MPVAFMRQFCAGFVLVALTVVMQSAGMAALIAWAKPRLAKGIRHFGVVRSAVLVVRFTSLIVWLHMLEILMWSCFYRWQCLPTWESAIYFSTTSYSTVGYGDVLLPQPWRQLGPVESLVGILMCGVSVSLLFAIVIRLVERDEKGV
jgi:voltage-gated potassium channel